MGQKASKWTFGLWVDYNGVRRGQFFWTLGHPGGVLVASILRWFGGYVGNFRHSEFAHFLGFFVRSLYDASAFFDVL